MQEACVAVLEARPTALNTSDRKETEMIAYRSVTLAALAIGMAGQPALASTCNMTVMGAHVVDDEGCTVTIERGAIRVQVTSGGLIEIKRSIMSARLVGDQLPPGRRQRATSYGQIVVSNDPPDKTCYFSQKAVLCVE